jgi:endoglucanase
MHLPSLLLGFATVSTIFASPAPNADPAPNERSVSTNKKRSNFWFAGVNESGAEFGSGTLPGVLGTNYIWPLTSTVDVSLLKWTKKEPVAMDLKLMRVIDFDGKGL